MEITRHRALPGGRAVLGGVLVAAAAVGVYTAYDRAGRQATEPVVIATHDLRVGEVLDADDLRTVAADLPESVSARSFSRLEELVGRVVLGPVGASEIVHAGQVTDQPAGADLHEVALTLPRAQLAVGRLKPGERIDLYVSYDDRTTSVARGAEVVEIGATDGGSLTSEGEVTIVVAVPTGEAVAALVHALRTGDVTVVRSTFAAPGDTDPVVFTGDGTPTTVEAADG